MRFLLVFFIIILNCRFLSAQSVGLNPTVGALILGETQTAHPQTGQAMFYNPAGLAHQSVHLQLLGTEVLVDSQSANQMGELSKLQDSEMKSRVEGILQQAQSRYIKTNLEALNIEIPYFGIKSFSSIDNKFIYNSDNLSSNLNLNLGVIAGCAIKWNFISFGVSKYILNRAIVNFNPSGTDLTSLQNAITQGSLENELQKNASNYTTAKYGQASGTNLGMMIKFYEDNDSGIGYSILNVGGAAFKDKSQTTNSSIDKMETQLKTDAAKYGITLTQPDTLPEIRNFGLNFSSDKNSIYYSSFSADYDDISGSYIKNKQSYSLSLGLKIPRKDVFALSTFVTNDKIKTHVGLLKSAFHFSYRPNESQSEGLEISLHSGVEKKISLLGFNILAMRTKSLVSTETLKNLDAASITLNLILIF